MTTSNQKKLIEIFDEAKLLFKDIFSHIAFTGA